MTFPSPARFLKEALDRTKEDVFSSDKLLIKFSFYNIKIAHFFVKVKDMLVKRENLQNIHWFFCHFARKTNVFFGN